MLRVSRFMLLEIRELNEFLLADFADVLLQVVVVTLQMCLEILFRFEKLITDGTVDRLLVAMRLEVNVQVSFRVERFRAEFTLEELHAKMSVLVIDEILFAVELLWTERAAKVSSLWFRVNSFVSYEICV